MNLAQFLDSHRDTPDLVLRIAVYYARPYDVYKIEAYRRSGEVWQTLPVEQTITTDSATFQAAIQLSGWTMAQRPVRKETITFNYFLTRAATVLPMAPTYTLDSRAANDLADKARREAERRQFAEEIGAEYQPAGQRRRF